MSDQAAAAAPPKDQPVVPPFDPDPALIDHLEGNERARRGYRRDAKRLQEQARR